MNGRKVDRTRLSPGDRIEIGDTAMVVAAEGADAPPPRPERPRPPGGRALRAAREETHAAGWAFFGLLLVAIAAAAEEVVYAVLSRS